MIRALTLFGLIMATPAQACHKYSVWHYPWRQTCGVFRAQVVKPEPPPMDERERAIEKLKELMNAKPI